jgi:nucleotidyltransferase/DNA polymerase involved in DNA repair
MPRVKAGEMSLPEIRNLARQHNKASTIKDVDKLSRSALINEIEKMGYRLDHEKKRIIKRTMTNEERKAQNKSVSVEGERKPQKSTKKKMLKAAGEAPVMVKPKAKPPSIQPALEKQRKAKAEKEFKRKSFLGGYINT